MRQPLPPPSPEIGQALAETPYLIMGAGGSIGSALALRLAQLRALFPGFRPSETVRALAQKSTKWVCA